jgi:hypothetical protein
MIAHIGGLPLEELLLLPASGSLLVARRWIVLYLRRR